MRRLTEGELRERLRGLGMPTAGTKGELVERLVGVELEQLRDAYETTRPLSPGGGCGGLGLGFGESHSAAHHAAGASASSSAAAAASAVTAAVTGAARATAGLVMMSAAPQEHLVNGLGGGGDGGRGEEAIARARRHIDALISAREETVRGLQQLLPEPTSEKEAARAAKLIVGDADEMAARRGTFLSLLGELRTRSAALVEGIGAWRGALRRASRHHRHLPDAELVYWHRGAAYPAKLAADLAFLPLPIAADPLLLGWFADHLPWMARHLPKVQRLRGMAGVLAFAAEAAEATAAPIDQHPVLAPDAGAAREREAAGSRRRKRSSRTRRSARA